jgi:hypothetical protein
MCRWIRGRGETGAIKHSFPSCIAITSCLSCLINGKIGAELPTSPRPNFPATSRCVRLLLRRRFEARELCVISPPPPSPSTHARRDESQENILPSSSFINHDRSLCSAPFASSSASAECLRRFSRQSKRRYSRKY